MLFRLVQGGKRFWRSFSDWGDWGESWDVNEQKTALEGDLQRVASERSADEDEDLLLLT